MSDYIGVLLSKRQGHSFLVELLYCIVKDDKITLLEFCDVNSNDDNGTVLALCFVSDDKDTVLALCPVNDDKGTVLVLHIVSDDKDTGWHYTLSMMIKIRVGFICRQW